MEGIVLTTNNDVGADIRAKLDAVMEDQKGKPDLGVGVDPALVQAQNEAKFWQLKYFELQAHTSQVISALSRQTVVAAFTEQLKGLGT